MGSTLVAKANVGTGTDGLAGVDTPNGFAGAAKLVDATGADIASGNPLPVSMASPPSGAATDATIEAVNSLLNEIAVRLCDIADSVGNLSPDVSGRIRVAAESVANIATITTVTTVSTVTTVGTVTTMTQIGAVPAVQAMYAFTQMNEYCLRQNVVIS